MTIPKHIIAHEIGHILVAMNYGFNILSVDIVSSKPNCGIHFNSFHTSSKELANGIYNCSNIEFITNLCVVMTSGDICEELDRVDFDPLKFTGINSTTDDEIVQNIIDHYQLDHQDVVNQSATILCGYKNLLITHIEMSYLSGEVSQFQLRNIAASMG